MHVCMYDVILNKTKVMIHSQEEEDDATWVCLTWRHSVEEMNLRPLMFLHISTKADVREDLHIRINTVLLVRLNLLHIDNHTFFILSLIKCKKDWTLSKTSKTMNAVYYTLSHLHNSRRPYLKTTTYAYLVY